MDTTLFRRQRRRAPSVRNSSPTKTTNGSATTGAGPTILDNRPSWGGERTVRRLRLSRALTLPDSCTVSEACRRMAAIRADAVLLTDSAGLLSGILTDKDIATRVIAEGLRPEHSIVSKIMTRNPVFVEMDSLAVEALQTMIQGKFRHLPVLENGEVVAVLDITRCLYDAISRMEKVVEQGSVIASEAEGMEFRGGNEFQDGALKGQMLEPTLSTIIMANSKIAVVAPSDPICIAASKMREFKVNYVIVSTGGKPLGILTSKDILMRIVARNMSPELTLVEKIMTPNPECAGLDTTVLDALHIMHDGKFLHLPVLDNDGCLAACVDVLQVIHAAIPIIEGSIGSGSDTGNAMMQKFLDSALAFEPPPEEQFDTHSERSSLVNLEHTESSNLLHSASSFGSSFSFKFQDSMGQIHRFNCGAENLEELISTVMRRLGNGIGSSKLQLLYEDDEGDKVLLTTDSDLIEAVNHSRITGSKVLKLHLVDAAITTTQTTRSSSPEAEVFQSNVSTSLQYGVIAGAIALVGIGIAVYLMRSKL